MTWEIATLLSSNGRASAFCENGQRVMTWRHWTPEGVAYECFYVEKGKIETYWGSADENDVWKFAKNYGLSLSETYWESN